MKGLDKTNSEIENLGGTLIETQTEFDNHYGGWITYNIYLLDGQKIYSLTDWDFQNP